MGDFMGRNDGGLTPAQEADLALAATALQPADVGTMAAQNASAVAITGGTSAAVGTKVVAATYPLAPGSSQSYGIPTPTLLGSSSAIVFADSQRFESRTSTTSLGASAGAISVGVYLFTNVPWTAYFRVRTGASLTNLCVWIGAAASGPSYSSTTPPAESGVARFIQGTDTKFTAIGRSSGSASAGAPFGPDLAPSTTYMIRIRNVPGTGMYYGAYAGADVGGNFGTEVLVTTVPTAGTGFGWVAAGGAYTAGTAVTFLWSLTQLVW